MSRITSRTAKAIMVALAPAILFSACDQSATAPALETVYNLVVETRYIEVLGTCDEDDFFGNPNAGEFQYRVDVSGEGQSKSHSSRGYNSVTGENFKRHKGTTIDFSNQTLKWFGISQGSRIDVKLSGTEWDGLSKDSDMSNLPGVEAVPFAPGKSTNSVTIGSGSCRVRLHYDATWAAT